MNNTSSSKIGTKRTDVSLAGGVVNTEKPNWHVLYLGGGGDLNCRLENETSFKVTKNLPTGVVLLAVAEIDPSGTTATDIEIWE